MKLIISGYYGLDNTGDEAILDSLVTSISNYKKDTEIIVLSADPQRTASQYSVRSIGRYSARIFRELLSCDVVISGGGGLLQDSTGRFSVAYYLGICALSKLMGKKFAVIGQGYGPINGAFNKWLSRTVLNKASIISVRDEKSLELMRKHGVTDPPMIVTADLAFLLAKEPFSQIFDKEGIIRGNKPTIGVCLRPLVKTVPDFEKKMASVLDRIVERYDTSILFIPFHFPEDVETSVRVASRMAHKANIITSQYPPRQVLGIISSLDTMIGMRLHSLIFASLSGVPMIGINYDPKVRSFLEKQNVWFTGPDFLDENFMDIFESTWKMRGVISSFLRRDLFNSQIKARLNITAFFEHFGVYREIHLMGIKINNVTSSGVLALAEEYIKSRKPHLILTPNPEIIIASQNDRDLQDILNSADLALPDGIGVLAISRLLGMPLTERVAGIDIMLRIMDLSKEKGYKVFLLGSAPGVAEEAATNLKGVNIVGTCDGYFKESEEANIVEKIRSSGADILFVGMGSPKQEKWLFRHYKEIGIPVNMAVGGSMDVISGRTKRAPGLARNLGIEWLYRLVKEPRRWKRQINLVKFVGHAIRQKLSGM